MTNSRLPHSPTEDTPTPEPLANTEPDESAQGTIEDKLKEILDRFLYTFAPDGTTKPDHYETMDLIQAKEAIVEAVEGIYGDSDGLREFASTGSNQVDTSVECPLSQRVDGKTHSWKFDGDDPYTLCVYCGELRDAITGNVITKGRTK